MTQSSENTTRQTLSRLLNRVIARPRQAMDERPADGMSFPDTLTLV